MKPTDALAVAVLVIGLPSVAIAGSPKEHPTYFIDKGACPFECCTYREWDVEKTTQLVKEPKDASPVVGTAEKGTTVSALTGEVHTKPGKLIVLKTVDGFRAGEILYVYTYLGEGYFKIWQKGGFIEEQIDFDYNEPEPDDWGRFEHLPNSVWWVKVRLPSGIEGWTDKSDSFSNQDACG